MPKLSKAILFLITTVLIQLAACEAVVEITDNTIDHKGIQLPDKDHTKTNLTCFSDHLLGGHCYGVDHVRSLSAHQRVLAGCHADCAPSFASTTASRSSAA